MQIDCTAAVHAILELRSGAAVRWATPAPPWAQGMLSRRLYAVMRRSPADSGDLPIGIRGAARSERCAAWVSAAEVLDVILPTDLALTDAAIAQAPSEVAALQTLPLAAGVLAAHGHAGNWGPTGSVGMQLACGERITHSGSDLDLMLLAVQPLPRPAALALYRDLKPLPARVDLLIETPLGGMALADFALSPGPWLLRTPHGPVLSHDPWRPGDSCRTA